MQVHNNLDQWTKELTGGGEALESRKQTQIKGGSSFNFQWDFELHKKFTHTPGLECELRISTPVAS